jgi:hypothetical protein
MTAWQWFLLLMPTAAVLTWEKFFDGPKLQWNYADTGSAWLFAASYAWNLLCLSICSGLMTLTFKLPAPVAFLVALAITAGFLALWPSLAWKPH